MYFVVEWERMTEIWVLACGQRAAGLKHVQTVIASSTSVGDVIKYLSS